jgi:hypothetical protein
VSHSPEPQRDYPLATIGILLAAVALAAASVRPSAGSWNDSSRLATVECLVDYHTLAIDHSLFVRPATPGEPSPFPEDEFRLRAYGMLDKLYIQGHYYSDKSPVPALLLALVYQLAQWCTGLTARARPDLFCALMGWASSGLAYVVAVGCVFKFGRPLRLPLPARLSLTASFGLSTLALVYVRHVNNHILLLGVAAAVMLLLARLAEVTALRGRASVGLVLLLGTLAGLGYTIDLGAGPVLLLGVLGVVAWRCRSVTAVALAALAALPWLALHHAVNYAVGGTFKPANAVAEYFLWPGCPFNAQNMTGGWNHRSFGRFVLYALDLLVGRRGFLGHNLPLYLALPALVGMLWRRGAALPELLFTGFWCGGTWLAYAVTSTNSSGLCCSIRWFVPLLAPAYYALAVCLRDHPACRAEFLILSCWGCVLTGLAWWHGPWFGHMVPCYWQIQAAALLTCLGYRRWLRPAAPGRPAAEALPGAPPARAA